MGILSGIGTALRAVADTFDQNKPRDMSDPRYWADFGGLASTAGVPVTERRVSQLGAVQAMRYGLSSAMSSLPVSVLRRGKGGTREALPDHPLTRLLAARPNDRNTPAEFTGEIAWHLSSWRNAYCRIRPGTDPTADSFAVGALEIIHPRRFARMDLLGTATITTPSIRRPRSSRARHCVRRSIAMTKSGICAATR